jgi:hypothetical protein
VQCHGRSSRPLRVREAVHRRVIKVDNAATPRHPSHAARTTSPSPLP